MQSLQGMRACKSPLSKGQTPGLFSLGPSTVLAPLTAPLACQHHMCSKHTTEGTWARLPAAQPQLQSCREHTGSPHAVG